MIPFPRPLSTPPVTMRYFILNIRKNSEEIASPTRIAKIPKREKPVLTPEQLALLFKITKRKYPYLVPIVQKMITLKQPLNTILTGNEQQKKSLKRKIRKDFYKIKQEMGLEDYKLDDLRFCNK